MIVIDNIFVVLDPTTDKQPALDRAVRIAKITHANIHAYLCVYSGLETDSPDELRRVEISRYELWLEKVLERVQEHGIDISSQIDWDRDWRNALCQAARKANSDLIIKPSYGRSAAKRIMRTSSDLALFRSATCPILFVTSEVSNDTQKVLMTIDAYRKDKAYKRIFDAVIAYGKAAAASYDNGELHVVYAYSGSREFVHITDLAKRTGVETSRVHVAGGEPEEIIVEVAKEIDAELIVMGVSTKSTLTNRVFGYTTEYCLNNIDNDILVVITEDTQTHKSNEDSAEVLPLL